ncbi:pyridoxamine 5'-phosphate oxidase family protein [Yoonia sediminilitoris]|uniref:Pyridoxine/pyridoxamine 5'-phosphate oxidase n=1 Tax=Yoonia sediminilitoris TaxID=1286148 RepID=A0A2T6KPJ3_9RHOB|nr:pyridoxamine 5'-phosphate oxidase family protein [Yoonia sediminilitoris]PUB18445.1 pyridoxine/pyridoxamine 5'-phosphate oxidase [Yoonia sediminilitoris]RCW98613.1 pyridoxine/pyridoxamine 5'-phosphate oxidase [Yoonia sediminilitoris]
MSEWFESRKGMRDEVWDTIVQGLIDPDHPAKTPTFATVSPHGWPEARTVVIRGADPEAGTVSVYTDIYSDKVRSLKANPRAALVIWDHRKSLQVRLSLQVTVRSGASVRDLWEKVPDHSQLSYGVAPVPGHPIEERLAYQKRPDPDAFAVLDCEVLTIDAVYLGRDHQRAIYSRSDDWVGQWLSP